MRALVRPFLLGAAAVGILVLVAAVAVGVIADANGWRPFELSLGPVPVLAFERSEAGTATSYGPGLGLVALAGGLLNALAAALVRRAATRALDTTRRP